MSEDPIRVTAGRPGTTGGPDSTAGRPGTTGGHQSRRSGLPVPTEAIVLLATVLAILIAAAFSENFTAPVAWSLVTILAAAYILSRGLVKRGTGDDGL
ncbi:MAG: hypothetical protein H0U32_09445 [Thermoleophilaceae bacterium]|nr:hypothetical protein [Thermoleophilaceae bacterium]